MAYPTERSHQPREFIEWIKYLFDEGASVEEVTKDLESRGWRSIPNSTLYRWFESWRSGGEVTGQITDGYVDEFIAQITMRLDEEGFDADAYNKTANTMIKLLDNRSRNWYRRKSIELKSNDFTDPAAATKKLEELI